MASDVVIDRHSLTVQHRTPRAPVRAPPEHLTSHVIDDHCPEGVGSIATRHVNSKLRELLVDAQLLGAGRIASNRCAACWACGSASNRYGNSIQAEASEVVVTERFACPCGATEQAAAITPVPATPPRRSTSLLVVIGGVVVVAPALNKLREIATETPVSQTLSVAYAKWVATGR